jgi:MFS family permease
MVKKLKNGKIKKDTPRVKELKHNARRRSIKEGMFATSSFAFGNSYLSPFAIAINLSNSMVAMMSSIGGLLGPLTQLFSSRLIEKYPRKKVVLKAVFWESLMWLPLIIIGFLFYRGIIVDVLPMIFLLFFALHLIMSNISGPAWFSWMGDIVDEEYRGRWFAKRNLIHGFVSIILAICAAFFLDYFKKLGWTVFGFMILFGAALFFRLMSWNSFKKQYEPEIRLKKGYYFSFWSFLLKSPKNNFGRFALFRCTLAFAGTIASPLFVVYILRTLGFNYSVYISAMMMSSVFSIFLINLWGKFADKYGNYKTIVITSFFIPMVPILWTLSTSAAYLIFIPSIISGLAWSGFHLAAGNFIYDNVGHEKRGLAVSYYNMLLGIGTFLGAGLGAVLIKYLPMDLIFKPIILIFLISGVARILAIAIWLPKLKEVRKISKFEGRSAFKNVILKQTKPALIEEAHQIMSIKNYLFENHGKQNKNRK